LELLSFCLHYFQTGVWLNFQKTGLNKEFPQFNLPVLFIYNLVFFGFGEETGWRGFALPRLQTRFSALKATLVLTLFWALWHWPLFLYRPGYASMGPGGAAGWLLSLLTGSVLLTWLYNSSRGSVMVCAIFHATIDIAFTSDYLDKNIVGLMGMCITLWGIAVILIYKPRNLSRSFKVSKYLRPQS
jgi:membrane protease YdiL (CAAX protease family)